MCQVSCPTLVSSKNVQILTISEFDENRCGSYISRDDSNNEFRFVIRDLEKFWIFTKITILPFFIKLKFSRVLQRILDSQDKVLQRKTVRLVKVLWRHSGVEEATWEREDTMRATYPFLFEDKGAWSNIWA